MQELQYFVNFRWSDNAPLEITRDEIANRTADTVHLFVVKPHSNSSVIAFTTHFAQYQHIPDLPQDIQDRNTKEWNNYWQKGGFVDLTASSNPNATELQRRIITSQYHVRVNSAASEQSPQESGLMNNGWYGKFHMEMVLWHNA